MYEIENDEKQSAVGAIQTQRTLMAKVPLAPKIVLKLKNDAAEHIDQTLLIISTRTPLVA
mgnify:CR=1 FL=1